MFYEYFWTFLLIPFAFCTILWYLSDQLSDWTVWLSNCLLTLFCWDNLFTCSRTFCLLWTVWLSRLSYLILQLSVELEPSVCYNFLLVLEASASDSFLNIFLTCSFFLLVLFTCIWSFCIPELSVECFCLDYLFFIKKLSSIVRQCII